MKKKIGILLALLIVISALPISLSAQQGLNEPIVLYRLSDDPAFTGVAPGSVFDFEGNLFFAGVEAELTVGVSADGQRYLESNMPQMFHFQLAALEVGNHIRATIRVTYTADHNLVAFSLGDAAFTPIMASVELGDVGDVLALAHTITNDDFMHFVLPEGVDIPWWDADLPNYADLFMVDEGFLQIDGRGSVEFVVMDIVIYDEEPVSPYLFNLTTETAITHASAGDAIRMGFPRVVHTQGYVNVADNAAGERYVRVPMATDGMTINLFRLEPGNFIRLVGRIDYVDSESAGVNFHSIYPIVLAEVESPEPGDLFVLEYLFTEADFGPREAYHWCEDTEEVVFGMHTPNVFNIWSWGVEYSIFSLAIYHEYSARPESVLVPGYTVIHFTIGSTTWTNNGVAQTLEVAPFIYSNRAMVPLRFVAEALDAEVDLLRGQPRVVTLGLGDIELRLTVGEALPNDMGTPVIRGGRVFVPIGYVSDVLGITTHWCDETNSVYVYVPAQ